MITLFDINETLCDQWKQYFEKEIKEGIITVEHKSLKEIKSDYLILAGNSYGWMTGGIDLAARNYFGQQLQDRIQQAILSLPGRTLPVGQMIILPVMNMDIHNVVYAPTMDIPRRISKVDIFYVFAKILEYFPEGGFACCGLGTATGGVSETDCAFAMHEAFKFMKGKL